MGTVLTRTQDWSIIKICAKTKFNLRREQSLEI